MASEEFNNIMDEVYSVEQLCKKWEKEKMDGLNKFKAEIQAEIEKADEKKKAYAKTMGEAILKHIESVCDTEYDGLLNQEHKSFRRMWTFVKDKAKDRAINGCACVDDATVFSWIDEYVGLDDKAEVEAEEKKKAEQKAKLEQTKAKVAKGKKTTEKTITVIKKPDTTETEEQVSIFDLM